MSDAATPNLDSHPRLAAGVRLGQNNNQQVLLMPERALRLNGPSLEIVQRCDGKRTVREIVTELQQLYSKAEPAKVNPTSSATSNSSKTSAPSISNRTPMSKSDKELVDSIAPYVMKKLASTGFLRSSTTNFVRRKTRLCPSDAQGKYDISEPLLRSLGFNDEELSEIFQVLQSKGGNCDCEILYNAIETSRLKAKYWKSPGGRITTDDTS